MCSILLQQYVAGHSSSSSRMIGGVAVSVTRKGLPRIIPHVQRILIRKGDVSSITLWLSMFNIYRYIECEYGEPKLNTITDSSNG